jgi:hypothetical protein
MKKAKKARAEPAGLKRISLGLDPKTLVVAVLVLIAAILLLSYHPSKTAETGNADKPVCKDNENKTCFVGKCSGSIYCRSGEWSTCIVDRICVPGSTKPCVENYCAYGYKTCDECGTGYGQCVLWGNS